MQKKIKKNLEILKKVSLLVILGAFLVSSFAFQGVNAQTTQESERAQLEAEYNALLKEIAEWEKTLGQQKKETGTISGDIKILTSKIEKAKTEVKAKTIAINNLSKEIHSKNSTILTLEEKIAKEKETLAQLIRKTNEYSDTTIIHLVLGEDSLSSFYSNNDSYASLRSSIKESVDGIKTAKAETEGERRALQEKQDAELDAKMALEKSKKDIEQSESEKKQLLSISKNKEASYQKILSDRQAKAAQLRAALFPLRDSSAIAFGDALDFAELASKNTGVRPALVLAILEQESSYGKNIGSCYLKDTVTGAGVGKNTGTPFANVMKPTRDVTPFLNITKKLGRDPFTTPVSCPFTIGYGGAMGPSQFIPSTWVMFENRIAASVGVSLADPWIPYHAITATSLYMKDLGAGAQTYTAERNAACRYYGGGTACTSITSTYGNQVMAKAATIQANIDIIDSV